MLIRTLDQGPCATTSCTKRQLSAISWVAIDMVTDAALVKVPLTTLTFYTSVITILAPASE